MISANAEIRNSVVSLNRGQNGGGFSLRGSSDLSVSSRFDSCEVLTTNSAPEYCSLLSGNTALGNPAVGGAGKGGAIYMTGSSVANIRTTHVIGNSADAVGGEHGKGNAFAVVSGPAGVPSMTHVNLLMRDNHHIGTSMHSTIFVDDAEYKARNNTIFSVHEPFELTANAIGGFNRNVVISQGFNGLQWPVGVTGHCNLFEPKFGSLNPVLPDGSRNVIANARLDDDFYPTLQSHDVIDSCESGAPADILGMMRPALNSYDRGAVEFTP